MAGPTLCVPMTAFPRGFFCEIFMNTRRIDKRGQGGLVGRMYVCDPPASGQLSDKRAFTQVFPMASV